MHPLCGDAQGTKRHGITGHPPAPIWSRMTRRTCAHTPSSKCGASPYLSSFHSKWSIHGTGRAHTRTVYNHTDTTNGRFTVPGLPRGCQSRRCTMFEVASVNCVERVSAQGPGSVAAAVVPTQTHRRPPPLECTRCLSVLAELGTLMQTVASMLTLARDWR
jgi:hypothetical protein